MIGSAQSAHLVDSVILSRHTACLAPPNVAILRMYTSSESHFLLPAKRLALRMPLIVDMHCYLQSAAVYVMLSRVQTLSQLYIWTAMAIRRASLFAGRRK